MARTNKVIGILRAACTLSLAALLAATGTCVAPDAFAQSSFSFGSANPEASETPTAPEAASAPGSAASATGSGDPATGAGTSEQADPGAGATTPEPAAPIAEQAAPNNEAPAESVQPTNVTMSLVFDVSGSMENYAGTGATKLDAAKRQSTAFVDTIRNTGEEGNGGVTVKVGMASFASTLDATLQPTTDADAINSAINGMVAWGLTNIYAGLHEGIEQVRYEDGAKMVVLLSDGVSNEGPGTADIIALAEEAASEDIKVYTIGFGSGSDIDEKLLQDIADITGGEYSHEDASELHAAAVGLFAVMKKAEMSATGDVVFDATGSVALGETTDVGQFTVDQAGTLTTYLYWPGSELDMILLDPQGTEVTEGYPGYSIDTTTIPTTITIANAAAGTWSAAVYGREVSMANEPFWVGSVLSPGPAQVATGGSTSSGSGLFLVLIIAAIGSIGAAYAFSIRKVNEEKDWELYG